MTAVQDRGVAPVLSGAHGAAPRLTLLVITDGRGEYLARTVDSARRCLRGSFTDFVLVDDSCDARYREWLEVEFPDFHQYHHEAKLGLSGSVRTGWWASPDGPVFHLEDDFTFTRSVDVDELVGLLADDPTLAQVCLQRQPINPQELAAGGIIRANPGSYTPDTDRRLELHRELFSLNPGVYPQWVRDLGWPDGGGEREFTDRLQARRPDAWLSYSGGRDDAPLVWHIGNMRSRSWTL